MQGSPLLYALCLHPDRLTCHQPAAPLCKPAPLPPPPPTPPAPPKAPVATHQAIPRQGLTLAECSLIIRASVLYVSGLKGPLLPPQ